MKNQQFQLNLLIKQNTEMSIRLQSYRRENQILKLKNQDLNCWVQNLSQVFASISAAWKIMTDNEEALYTLIRKKSDPLSKQIVSKYISHFKAFDEIITNLGDKITNEGHSDNAKIEAKERLSSFVNNYQLFFLQFVQTFFKFNEDCIAASNEQLKDPNMHVQLRQIVAESFDNRQRIKDFECFMTKINQNVKLYQTFNQHQLLDGIVMQKENQIQALKDKYQKQARRIAYMTDYSTQNVNAILEHEEQLQCFCGGGPLQYYNKVWEQSIRNQGSGMTRKQSSKLLDQSEQLIKQKMKQFHDLQVEKQLLLQRNAQILAKSQKIKLQNRLTDDLVLQSPLYLHLRNQFKDLMDYTNDLTMRMNKSYEYINQLEKSRLDQIQEIKKKCEKPHSSSHRNLQSEPVINVDHSFLHKFKEKFQKDCHELKTIYMNISQSLKEKEDQLVQKKNSLKHLKRQNQDLNKKLSQIQQKAVRNIEQLEFRHQKYNDLQKQMAHIFKSSPQSEELQSTRKTWQELVQYTKNRDKKIKAMEDMIKQKDKLIFQKQKIEQVMKNALTQTETVYQKCKQKLDSFQSFMKTMEKDILNLTEQNYHIKMESEQEKGILNFRLKNQLEIKSKLEEKVKNIEKVEDEMKIVRQLSTDFQKKIQEYQQSEKERRIELRLQIKQRQRINQQLQNQLNDKDKMIQKAIEDKEKKNLEIDRLNVQIRTKTDFEYLKMELEQYKSKIMCRCGAERQRQIALKTCPHIFCKKCIDDTTTHRNRKCPICGIRFSKADISQINWN